MQINLHLHGILRDQLPAEKKGKTTLTLQAGATLQDLLYLLKFNRPVQAAVNNEVELADDHPLTEGDEVALFTVIGGG